MKRTYVIDLLVPVSLEIEAGSEAEARLALTTDKAYSMTAPDGSRIDLEEDHIQAIEAK